MQKKITKQRNERGPNKSASGPAKTAIPVNRVNTAENPIIKTNNPRANSGGEPPPYAPSEDTKKYLQSKRRNWERISAFIGAVGLVVFFGQALIYYLTLREVSRSTTAAQNAVNQGRDNFRQDQRPYIWLTNSLGKPECVKLPGAPQDAPDCYIVWDWHYVNYGKTPAYNVRITTAMEVGASVLQRPRTFDPDKPGPPLPPNKDDFVTAVWKDKVSKGEFDKLMDTEEAILVRGRITYTDTYGGQYETGFCFFHLRTGAAMYCGYNERDTRNYDNYIK